MLTELLSSGIMKENLLKVVTNLGPPKASPEQRELCFQITPIAQRYLSAWEIIDKVYDNVKGKNLTVGAVLLELEKESKKGGKSWWSKLLSFNTSKIGNTS